VWRLLEMTDARVLVRLLRVLPHTIALRLPHPSAIGNVRSLAPARRAHPTMQRTAMQRDSNATYCDAARQQCNVRSNNEAAMQRSARLRHSAGAHARPHARTSSGSARRQKVRMAPPALPRALIRCAAELAVFALQATRKGTAVEPRRASHFLRRALRLRWLV
jgi:hypothetical protein